MRVRIIEDNGRETEGNENKRKKWEVKRGRDKEGSEKDKWKGK